VDANQAKILYHLDQPDFGAPLSRCLILRGWCFAPDGGPVLGIRLKTGEITLAGIVGLPRPDVAAAMPSAPDDNTGFEIRGILPRGSSEIQIEAQLADQNWWLVTTRKVRVPGNWLPLWLGGGAWTELMFFQMPGHMKYPAKKLEAESFPSPKSSDANHPALSIVTPSFQQAAYLPDTLRSVLQQADHVDEYVIQDGGSTDGSAKIINSFATEWQHFTSKKPSSKLPALRYESKKDSGQSDAIATGFAKTSGKSTDLMAWINSDDFYLPGALAFVVDYFARHPEVDVIYGHRILVDETSREIGRWFLPPHDADVLRLNDFVPQETLFWRRRIWDKAGGLDKAFKFAMDWDLLLRFQDAGARIVRVPYFLGCFRIHPAQKTSASMHDTGQSEITSLRERTFRRPFPPQELEKNPLLLRYLRKSAWIEFLWKWRIRAG
jgi:glycosyltransferase involved in cell wall biosynthesis